MGRPGEFHALGAWQERGGGRVERSHTPLTHQRPPAKALAWDEAEALPLPLLEALAWAAALALPPLLEALAEALALALPPLLEAWAEALA